MSRQQIIHENLADMGKGIIGTGSTMLALLASHLDNIESWLRIISLVIGIAVAIATLISITRRKK